jgi:MFS family permease
LALSLTRIDVAPGGAAWRSVVPGSLAAVTALLVLWLLGLSVGLSQLDLLDQGDLGRDAGGWLAGSLLLAFMLGGYVTARLGRLRQPRHGIERGALVFLLSSPLLLLCAVAAGALLLVDAPYLLAPLRDAAWLAFLGCLLGLTGSMFGGLLAASRESGRGRRSTRPIGVQTAVDGGTRQPHELRSF